MRLVVLGRSYLVAALIAAALITGMATGLGLFYRLAYVFALVMAAALAWSMLSLRSLSVAVERPAARVTAGDRVAERIVVSNDSALPRPMMEVEDLTELPGLATASAMAIGPRSAAEWRPEGTALRRGAYEMGPVVARSTDPFGLFRRERTFPCPGSVVVYPRAHELPGFSLPAADLSGGVSLRRRTPDLTPHASTVREYAPGDGLGRVHWNSTARLGRLMSKEFDEGRAAEVWVAVDLHRDVQAGAGELSTDECAVGVAASLAAHFIASSVPVGLVAYGTERLVAEADAGPGQMDRVLACLAVSEAGGAAPIADALAADEALWDRNATLVVVTASPRPEWAQALAHLAGRRVRVAAVLIDGRSFGGFLDSADALPALHGAGVPVYLVGAADHIPAALAAPLSPAASAARGVGAVA